jgi:signal peptidase II
MDSVSKKNLLFFWSSGALILISDQLAKILIRLYGGFYICNPHIALGIVLPEVLFWLFWISIAVSLSYLIHKERAVSNKVYLIFIFSGAFSNLIDRIWRGCIIDFIQLGFGPVFNLADFFITLGVIMLILNYLKIKR